MFLFCKLISWQVDLDLVAVDLDLVAIDLVRIDLGTQRL